MPEETTDPDVKRAALLKMGTRDYDLEEARDARKERKDMLTSFAAEKVVLIRSHERTLKSKNFIIYALIAANLFQAALILGQSLTLEADESGVKVATGDVDESAAVEEQPGE